MLVPFELRPDLAPEGLQVSSQEAGGHSDRVEEHLVKLAERDGFPFVSPSFVPNTHQALELGELARDSGERVHSAVHAAIFDAHFGQGLDISQHEVLLGLADGLGLKREAVAAAWEAHTYDDRLHRFRHVALSMGLESTPAALICNELLIGSRPYEVLRAAVDRCLITPENVAQEAART